jgi:hypothetical protein
MVRAFGRSEPETALRAYLYLLGCAAYEKDGERIGKTVRSSRLAREFGLEHDRLLLGPLELLTRWCRANELPAFGVLGNRTNRNSDARLWQPGRAAESL